SFFFHATATLSLFTLSLHDALPISAGMPAVGFCGGDGMTFRARRKHMNGNDLGFVGEICFAEPCWIEALWQQGGIPVLASLALGDRKSTRLNSSHRTISYAVFCLKK